MKSKTKDMALIALFAALIALCSWLSIPAAVPFTLQTLGVFLAVGLLGGRRGTLAVAVYILLGAAGLPVFAGFKAGIGVLLGATGGYIVGFLAAALAMGAVLRRAGGGKWALLLSMILGLLICYGFGTAWFLLVYTRSSGAVGLLTVLGWCVFPFILPDALKIALAFVLCRRLGSLRSVQRLLA